MHSDPLGGQVPTVQLLYRSISRDGPESVLQMSDILDQARSRNARDGITGALTIVDGRFVQIIEGSAEALTRLMGKLLQDPRHSDLVVIEERPAARRLFGDWDMVSPKLAPMELAQLALLLETDDAGIDAYANVLMRAVGQQDAVLEGRRSPGAGSPGLEATSGRLSAVNI